jgi:lauroyl/myristoyl acyltransferase
MFSTLFYIYIYIFDQNGFFFYLQAMRNTHKVGSSQEKRERTKSINTVAARMKHVVEKMISSQKDGESRPQVTIFLYKSQQSEIIASFLNEMRKENVNLFNNKTDLMHLIVSRYEELIASLRPSSEITSSTEELCQ